MRPLRRRRWGMVGSRMSPGSLGATRKRCGTARRTWPNCHKTEPPAGSGKKGGRKAGKEGPAGLVEAVQEAVVDRTAGSPVDPEIRWTNRSPQEIARELAEQGYGACRDT